MKYAFIWCIRLPHREPPLVSMSQPYCFVCKSSQLWKAHTYMGPPPLHTHKNTHTHTHRRGQWCMRCSGGHALQVIQGLRRLGPGVADKRIAHIVMSLLVSVVTASSALDYTCVCVCVCVCVLECFTAAAWLNLHLQPHSGASTCP